MSFILICLALFPVMIYTTLILVQCACCRKKKNESPPRTKLPVMTKRTRPILQTNQQMIRLQQRIPPKPAIRSVPLQATSPTQMDGTSDVQDEVDGTQDTEGEDYLGEDTISEVAGKIMPETDLTNQFYKYLEAMKEKECVDSIYV